MNIHTTCRYLLQQLKSVQMTHTKWQLFPVTEAIRNSYFSLRIIL
jgi:hypothetical protein